MVHLRKNIPIFIMHRIFLLLIYSDSKNFLFSKSILCSYLKQCLTNAVFLLKSSSFNLAILIGFQLPLCSEKQVLKYLLVSATRKIFTTNFINCTTFIVIYERGVIYKIVKVCQLLNCCVETNSQMIN